VQRLRIMLIGRDDLAPGDDGLARIEPVFPELWVTVYEGAVVPVQEGARVVGHAMVEKVLFAEGFTPDIALFVWKAREFCKFIQVAGKLPIGERTSGARPPCARGVLPPAASG